LAHGFLGNLGIVNNQRLGKAVCDNLMLRNPNPLELLLPDVARARAAS